jgi:hypothetical protein
MDASTISHGGLKDEKASLDEKIKESDTLAGRIG